MIFASFTAAFTVSCSRRLAIDRLYVFTPLIWDGWTTSPQCRSERKSVRTPGDDGVAAFGWVHSGGLAFAASSAVVPMIALIAAASPARA
jgi:hypothetical protein